jgi:hypothetical protein
VKLVAAVLIVLLSASVGAPLSCTGWETSAADRQACCKRAHHDHCQDQGAADDCCAKHESARFATAAGSILTSGLTVTIAVLTHGAVAPLAPLPEGSALTRGLRQPAHAPPDLFSPPLRI